MALPKWTDERTEALTNFVGGESPVSQATVAEAADQLETSTRSISSKLRKMGYEVELASAASGKSFTEGQEATLRAFVTDNSGQYTYAQIAEHFEGGSFSPKSIQGKILSMELTDHVAPAPKVESVRTYTQAEEATFVSMVNGSSNVNPQDGVDVASMTVEAIAESIGKTARGVKTMLTRRGLTAADYDGAAKAAKAAQ